MKIIYRFLPITLTLSLILISCKEPEIVTDLNSMNFDELFGSYILSTDSTFDKKIITMLQDSLKPECNWAIEIKDSFDTIDKTFGINCSRLDLEATETEWKGRGVISFLIIKKELILFQREVLSTYDSLEEKIVKSILNPTESWYLPKNEIKIINEVDTIRIPSRYIIEIATEKIGDSLACNTDWVDLKQVIVKVLFACEKIRNDYSLKIYKSEFKNLNIDNKIKLSEMIPIWIWININRRIPPPPPPPPLPPF